MLVESAALLAASEFRDPLLPLWAMELLASVFFYAWLFCLGATVGSFLNVVVYRLPRNRNLAYPGSYCPRCGHPIRLFDNIPIVSWLWLGGHCRDCRGPISPRYFVVELSVATTFLLVLAAEHFLPPGSLGFTTRRKLTSLDAWPFWSMYITHVVLVTTLLAAVLIRADGFRVPSQLYVPAFAVGCLLPLFWPEVRRVPALANRELALWQAAIIDGLAGLCAGLAMGVAAYLSIPRSRGLSPVALCCSLGVVLGWQRTILWSLPILLVCMSVAQLITRFAPGDVPSEPQPLEKEAAPADSQPIADSNSAAPATAPPQNLDPP